MVKHKFKIGDIILTTENGANATDHSRYKQPAKIGDIFQIFDMDNDYIFSKDGYVIRQKYAHNHFRLATDNECNQYLPTKDKQIKKSDVSIKQKQIRKQDIVNMISIGIIQGKNESLPNNKAFKDLASEIFDVYMNKL